MSSQTELKLAFVLAVLKVLYFIRYFYLEYVVKPAEYLIVLKLLTSTRYF